MCSFLKEQSKEDVNTTILVIPVMIQHSDLISSTKERKMTLFAVRFVVLLLIRLTNQIFLAISAFKVFWMVFLVQEWNTFS